MSCESFKSDPILRLGMGDEAKRITSRCPQIDFQPNITLHISKHQFKICTSPHIVALVLSIPCNFSIEIKVFQKIDNARNPNDSTTFIGALTTGDIDLAVGFVPTLGRSERVIFSFPFLFQTYKLIVNSGLRKRPLESIYLMLTPFDQGTWILVGITVLLFELFIANWEWVSSQVERFPPLRLIAENLAIFSVLYSSNLRAIVAFPQSPKLPFSDASSFVDFYIRNDLRFIHRFPNDYRMSLLRGSANSDVKRWVATFNRTMRVTKAIPQFIPTVSQSKKFVALYQRDSFLAYFVEILHRYPHEMEFLNYLDLPQASISVAIGRQRGSIVEFISRNAEVSRAILEMGFKRKYHYEKFINIKSSNQDGLLTWNHLRLVFVMEAIALVFCILVFIIELGHRLLTQGLIERYTRLLLNGSILGKAKLGLQRESMGTQAAVLRVNDVIKSPLDTREYRALKLGNGMRALLVSDPTTDKSAAALDVNVGHLKDPRELPGLAHFCEHMLFLGTEKYPSENEYHKYLAAHGGSSNAYTGSDHTNYFFDVAPDHLEGALDRFAQFFLNPLFTESATEREVNAVDSENSNNLQNDLWRMMQLQRSLSNPEHDFSKFGTGSKQTLLIDAKAKNLDPREELLKFHNQHYSSNIMALCIVGRQSLEELEAMALNFFAGVENKNVQRYEWMQHPYGPEEVGHEIRIIPIKELRSLHVNFPIPDLHPHYRSQPGGYISHLLGHEGKGSLLSELKNRGWVSSLSAGPRTSARGFGFFSVDLDLSEEGLEHAEDIVGLMFGYIGLMLKETPKEWIQEECRKLNEIRFKFKDKERAESLVMSKASDLHDYPEQEILVGPYLCNEFCPDLIQNLLRQLNPTNMNYAVVSKKFEAEREEYSKEKWYDTEYKRTKIPEAVVKEYAASLAQGHPNMKMPEPNEFIPSRFDIKCPENLRKSTALEGAKAQNLDTRNPVVGPEIIEDSDQTRLWHKLDDEYLLPKSNIFLNFSSPETYASPLRQNLAHMYRDLLVDDLTEFTYDAALAGLSYSFENGKYGMYLKVSGYDEKQGVLLKKLVERMVSLKPDPMRFQILKEKYIRALKNFKSEQPYQHAIYFTNTLLCERTWTKEQLINEVDGITVEALEAFLPEFLKGLHLEALFHGNVTSEEAKTMVKDIWSIIKAKHPARPLYNSQLLRDREVELDAGENYEYSAINEVHPNSALEIIYQVGVQETRENMLLELLGQIFSEPAFDTLRTKEQLGYIVFSGVRRSSGTQGLRFIVQGDRDPAFVEARVELFLRKMREDIAKMGDEEFEEHKAALSAKRLEKPKKLSGLASSFWGEILAHQYNFDRARLECLDLRDINKDSLIQFFDSKIDHSAAERKKLCVQVFSTKAKESHPSLVDGKDESFQQAAEELTNAAGDSARKQALKSTVIKDPVEFKRAHRLYHFPKPSLQIPPAGLNTDKSML